MVVEQGGSACAPLGEMCCSCLCGRLGSHGNHLSPLLFLKSTCLWEYHSEKKNDAYSSFFGDQPSQYLQQREVSHYLRNGQLGGDWSGSQVKPGDRLGAGKK